MCAEPFQYMQLLGPDRDVASSVCLEEGRYDYAQRIALTDSTNRQSHAHPLLIGFPNREGFGVL